MIVTNDSAMGPTVVVIVSWQVTISYLAFAVDEDQWCQYCGVKLGTVCIVVCIVPIVHGENVL